MRKFYSLFLVALFSLVSLGAGAKTVTLYLDPDAEGGATIVDAANGKTYTLTTAGEIVTVPASGNFIFKADDGYVCSKVTTSRNYDTGSYACSWLDIDCGNVAEYEMDWNQFVDTEWVMFKTVTDESAGGGDVLDPNGTKVTFVGPAGGFCVREGEYGNEYYDNDEDGIIKFNSYTGVYRYKIYAQGNYKFNSVTDQNGETYVCYDQFAEVATFGFSGDMVLTIDATDLSAVERSSFTVNVYGSGASKISFCDNKYNYVYFNEITPIDGVRTKVIEFDDGIEYWIKNSYYWEGTGFYRVTLNDTDLSYNSDGYYTFTPNNGDVVNIYTDAPEKEVKVNVTFTGTADAGIVSYFSYDYEGQSINNLLDGTLKPMLGKSIYISLDTQSYTNASIKVNGVTQTDTYLSLTLSDEAGYEIEIGGTRLEPYHVTVVTRDPKTIRLYKDYSYTEEYVLTGQVTELEVLRGNNNICFVPAENYKISNITIADDPYFTYASGVTNYYVNGDVEIEIETEEIVRDRQMVVYLDNTSWGWLSFNLSPNDESVKKEVELQPGYNFVNYGTFDFPLSISAYPSSNTTAAIYLNGVKTSGTIYAPEDLEENDPVIKIYGKDQATHKLETYVSPNANVQITHDHINTVGHKPEGWVNHDVLPGTMVHVTPVEAIAAMSMSRAAGDDAAEAFTVKYGNDEDGYTTVSPDADGRYPITVTADTKIQVHAAGDSTGVDNVSVDGNDNEAVYNLQGIRVNPENLPAGIYIKGGKKFRI